MRPLKTQLNSARPVLVTGLGAGTTLAAALILALARTGAGEPPPAAAAAQPVAISGGVVTEDPPAASPKLLLVRMDHAYFKPGPILDGATVVPVSPVSNAASLPPTPAPLAVPAPLAAAPPPAVGPPPKPPKGRHQSGMATWFGAPKGTCAHLSLPIGTVVTVTASTGVSTTCRVNDRGPTGAGVVIDLSTDSFAKLADPSTGVIDVKLQW